MLLPDRPAAIALGLILAGPISCKCAGRPGASDPVAAERQWKEPTPQPIDPAATTDLATIPADATKSPRGLTRGRGGFVGDA
jgi:hypothetical protein